jgi:glycine/D-amino acid oxidase-like deaminating enzyme
MTADYLVIGQGLCGTFLSYYLKQAGKKVIVIDESNPFTASKVASGVINPVTGRRIVRTWRIEELLPFALDAYTKPGNEFGQSLVKKCSLLDFHPSQQMKEAFEKRLGEEPQFLHKSPSSDWKYVFNYHFDIGEIFPCLLVDINKLLKKWREKLLEENSLLDEKFTWEDLTVNESDVTYRNIAANKIIFCDGVTGMRNPYFRNLPYAPNKGEALIAKINDLAPNHIYKQGISIVPWQDNLFWIGSSYEWNFTHAEPTIAYREKVTAQLRYWLKVPFEIVDHVASLRPANMERRPFVGVHPKFSAVAILNGMGTKGCSLAPFFAKQLSDYLTEGKPIYGDADVSRFEKILARKWVN